MILITGASGMVGGTVLKEVLKKGAATTAMYRSQDDSGSVPSGARAVYADFSKLDTLARALDGVNTVSLVCSPVPQLVEYESNTIDACSRAGVKRIVDNSALGAWTGGFVECGGRDKDFAGYRAHRELHRHSNGRAEKRDGRCGNAARGK